MNNIVVLLLVGAWALPSAAAMKLNLFIWSDYLDPQIVADFEKRHECKVNIDLYEEEASMMARLQGGGVSQYDVVVPPNHVLPALIKLQLLAPLRHERVPNLRHLDDRFLNPPFDPGNRYSAAYQWGTVGLFVRRPPGRRLAESWALIFDPGQQPGPFVMIDSMRDMIGAALKFKGHSMNSTDPAHLKEARDLLLSAKQRSLGFEGGVGGRNKVLSRVATLAVTYSGDAVRAMREATETVYIVPREGAEIWVDSMVVPARAPHRDLAEQFINFVLDPQVGARLSAFTRFASPNRAAQTFLKAEDLKNPAIYPPPEVRSRLEFLVDVGRQTRLYDEIWTQVKSK